jgi:hypothetical protein
MRSECCRVLELAQLVANPAELAEAARELLLAAAAMLAS